MPLEREPRAWVAGHPRSQAPAQGRQAAQPGRGRVPKPESAPRAPTAARKRKKINSSSRPSKSSFSCLRLLLGQMTNASFSVFFALKCLAGSECSAGRYRPICQSNHQQLH